jgi:adenylate cyclase
MPRHARARSAPVLAAGLAVVLASAALAIWNPPLLQALSRQAHDLLLRGRAVPPQSGAVAIVDIDEASLAAVGQWPWPRALLARMTDRLWEAGASVVVYDVVFPEPDRTSPEQIRDLWGRLTGSPVDLGAGGGIEPFDAQFAAALARGRSVLGCYLEMCGHPAASVPAADDAFQGRLFERNAGDRSLLPQADAIVHSLPQLAAASSGAFFNTTPDPDRITRRTPLVWVYGPDRVYPSLALDAVRLHLGLRQAGLFFDAETGTRIREIRLRDVVIPVDHAGRLVLNYRRARFPSVSAADVLGRSFDPALVSNRIVFVGTSAAGLKDLVATPLEAEFPGVEVHATAVDNILAGDALREQSWFFYVTFAGILLGGGLVTVAAWRLRSGPALAVAVATVSATIGAAALMLHARNLVLSPAEIAVACALAYSAVTAVRYGQEERDRRRVRAMFGTMVSPEVLHFMEDHPESFTLAGERREVTVLFSDLAGFTGIAEHLEARRLSELMNRVMTPLTETVLAGKGMVNKYVGDAIMAVWSAPFDLPDHAAHACRAAVGMQRTLDALRPELQSEFGCDIRMRIGINTGPVTAGNMGSSRRFEYTVLGDTVNQASRFEAENKVHGTRILAGEATVAAAGAAIASRRIGSVTIRGRAAPVDIYEIIEPPPPA